MRRRGAAGAAHWLAFEEHASNLDKPFGASILQRFRNRAFLTFFDNRGDDAQLLQSKLRLGPNLALDLQQQWLDGAWRTVSIQLHQGGGLQQSLRIDGHIAAFLEKLDGERTLGELIAALSAHVAAPGETVRKQVLNTMRQLLERGYLLPA
jgi:hypothetical protein